MTRRAQVVLAAAVVVAVALVPMLVAYLQLGYPPDTAATAADRDDDAVDDARRYLGRSAARAATDARGVAWANRSTAVRRVTGRLADATARLEARGVARERVYRVGYNRTVAARLARDACPRGDDRAFGPCEAAGGLVLQERVGETTVVAVAFDLSVSSPRRSTNATVVVRPRP
ncbi:MAG: hypothetical protein ABEJ43_01825 [Haloferacaceae archaeon]